MGLVHEFFIEDDYVDNELSSTYSVSISDDLVQYINDTFSWIKSIWNKKDEKIGLNYYGYSIITNKNIKILKNIIEAWINLFSNAEDTIILTGSYLIDEMEYEKIIFKKNDILKQLNLLKNLLEIAIKDNKNIYYQGI